MSAVSTGCPLCAGEDSRCAWPESDHAVVRCPDSPVMSDGAPHTVIGCGQTIPDVRDDEGLVDCPRCGIWFNPDEESEVLK